MINLIVKLNGVDTEVDRDLIPTDEAGRHIEFLKDAIVDGMYEVDTEVYTKYLSDIAEKNRKELGENYTKDGLDYLVSFKKDDADGLASIKLSSDFLGVFVPTTFVFENGTKLPISTLTEFNELLTWFIPRRASFFI